MDIKKRKTYIGIGILIITAFVFLDQFTKHLAVLYLKDQPNIVWIKGVMELEYLETEAQHLAFCKTSNGCLFCCSFFL